jgi:MazG nucleotide pyrophosphohydrolase domain
MTDKTLDVLQQEAADILGDDLKHPRIGATLALVEELGELVKEIVEIEIYRQSDAREKLQDEVGDVLFSLFESVPPTIYPYRTPTTAKSPKS